MSHFPGIPSTVRKLAAPLALAGIAATWPAAAATLGGQVGQVVWNRAIYRLEATDGSSFRIKALAPLKVTRVEVVGGEEVPWFEVDQRGLARVSRSDVERIGRQRRSGKLPADWSWVYLSDPRGEHTGWDDKFWKAIEERTIVYEMTPEMVRMAFGEPDRINLNPRPENVQEHWIYDTGSLWFVEGKVFTWQAP